MVPHLNFDRHRITSTLNTEHKRKYEGWNFILRFMGRWGGGTKNGRRVLSPRNRHSRKKKKLFFLFSPSNGFSPAKRIYRRQRKNPDVTVLFANFPASSRPSGSLLFCIFSLAKLFRWRSRRRRKNTTIFFVRRCRHRGLGMRNSFRKILLAESIRKSDTFTWRNTQDEERERERAHSDKLQNREHFTGIPATRFYRTKVWTRARKPTTHNQFYCICLFFEYKILD